MRLRQIRAGWGKDLPVNIISCPDGNIQVAAVERTDCFDSGSLRVV